MGGAVVSGSLSRGNGGHTGLGEGPALSRGHGRVLLYVGVEWAVAGGFIGGVGLCACVCVCVCVRMCVCVRVCV